MINRNTQWTRRRFIQYIGATAGTAAAFRTAQAIGLFAENASYEGTPDLPSGSGTGKRVIILGAGIAGMTAAYELSNAGYLVGGIFSELDCLQD